MAEVTDRFSIPYPSYQAESWFDVFESMIGMVDTGLFADHEDRNLVVGGGGTVYWYGGVLTWTQPIAFTSPTFGKTVTVAAGSEPIAAGQFLFVVLPRGPSDDAVATLQVDQTLVVDWNYKVVAWHDPSSGDLLFCNGIKLADGELTDSLNRSASLSFVRCGYESVLVSGIAHQPIVGVNTAAPVTVTIPTSVVTVSGKIVVVKDRTGGAGLNNVTIACQGGALIDGAVDYTI